MTLAYHNSPDTRRSNSALVKASFHVFCRVPEETRREIKDRIRIPRARMIDEETSNVEDATRRERELNRESHFATRANVITSPIANIRSEEQHYRTKKRYIIQRYKYIFKNRKKTQMKMFCTMIELERTDKLAESIVEAPCVFFSESKTRFSTYSDRI